MFIYKTWFGSIELTKEQAAFIYRLMELDSIEDSVFEFSTILGQENCDPEDTHIYINHLMKRMK